MSYNPTIYTTGTFWNYLGYAAGWWGTIQGWDEDLDYKFGYNFRFSISGINQADGVTIGQCISSSPNGLFLANGGAVKGNSSATNPNTAFIHCVDRNTNSGGLSTKWQKVIELYVYGTGTNDGNPGFNHVEMDDEFIYAATQYSGFSDGNFKNPNFIWKNQVIAVIACFRISDGNIMWIKKFTVGSTTFGTPAKAITGLILRPDALYAAFAYQGNNAGYDYLKINPTNGFVTTQSDIVVSSNMTSGSSTGNYSIVTPTGFNFGDGSSADLSETVTGTTLEATDLPQTVSNQWGINPSSDKYVLQSFNSSSVSTSSNVCSATINQKYYFVGTTSSIAVGNDVYSDNLATSGLTNGYYRISSTQYIIVSSGSVSSINTCVTLTPFNAGNSSTFTPCSQFSPGANTYFHSGGGTYPGVSDIVYTTNSTSNPLGGGGSGTYWPYFAAGVPPGTIPVGWFRIIGSTGQVQSVGNCP
tara:strand:+ start:1028 stop:2440 length:1413 start_codon:yes stop_codon:yes gene_type:complete